MIMSGDVRQTVQVSVLLPCFNEQAALPSVIRDICAVMDAAPYSYEILVVDDKSSDSSAGIAAAHGCRVVRHGFNRGAGAARKTGILAAHGEMIVMLDADGSYPAADVPRAIALLDRYDQVNGVRSKERGTLVWLRQPTKWFIRMLASFLAGQKIPDLNTGFKVFRRDTMLPYLWCIPDGFSCVTSMTLAFICNGLSVGYIPIGYNARIGRSKFHPIRDTFNYVLTVLRLVTYFKPLKVYFPVAFFILAAGVSKSFYDYFFVLGRLQLSDIILVLTGVVVGLQGILADLIVAQARARDFVHTARLR
jgi:glycosyltransferase involved in cell wall biosynthesis